MSRYRKGENQPEKTGRAARTRTGTHLQRALIAARNSGHHIAREFLTGLGLDPAWVDQFESAFGRAAAKTYRTNHHAEPDTRGLVLLRGRLWRTNRYVDPMDLIAGAYAYKRTAHLIGAS